jgi:hypothetical protein
MPMDEELEEAFVQYARATGADPGSGQLPQYIVKLEAGR